MEAIEMTKRRNHQRYYGYILNIVEVGEIITVRQIHGRLIDYDPNEQKGLKRTFSHANLPTSRGIGGILRGKPHFENLGNGRWRRIE